MRLDARARVYPGANVTLLDIRWDILVTDFGLELVLSSPVHRIPRVFDTRAGTSLPARRGAAWRLIEKPHTK